MELSLPQSQKVLSLSYKTERQYSEDDLREIIELYQKYNFSLKLIGSFYGVSNVPIRAILKDLGKYFKPTVKVKDSHKICRICQTEKHQDCFQKDSNCADRLSTRCKTCRSNSRRIGRKPTIPPSLAPEIVKEYEKEDVSLNTLKMKYGFHTETLKKLLLKYYFPIKPPTPMKSILTDSCLKLCRGCLITKAAVDFGKRSLMRDGRSSKCLECTRKDRATESHRAVKQLWKENNRNKTRSSNAKRRAAKLNATPKWANPEEILKIYTEAKELSEITGILYHVDHKIPLISKLVCGLHCEANLQVLQKKENLIKNNLWWEDMPDNPSETIKELYKEILC